MCGIAGFYPSLERETSVSLLKRMLTRIKHRGPDQSGIYLSKEVGLGSVRLSIIDLKTGCMPLSNQDDSLWIVYNGEIFNYIELKEDLLKKGYLFKTSTDTEVILHLFDEYGPEFLSKLNGQFAIAIWDSKKKSLFLARDRVGIRPLFYTKTNGQFVFASEIKALLEYPGLNVQISPKAISQIFTFWTTITPNTAFENIFEVPPGHFIVIGANGIEEKSYWELPLYRCDEPEKRNFHDAVEEFRSLLLDAVRIRLRADVQVGAYLSGGIDSSITTAFIKDISPNNLCTFSIGFDDHEFDESDFQNLAVEYLNTEHVSMRCHSIDIANKFPEVIWHAESPLLRTAPTPMFLLSDVVKRKNFKVVITGEGADELLGGYDIFKEALIRQFWAKDISSSFRPLLLKKLYPYLPQMDNPNLGVLKMFYGYKLEETSSPVYSHLLRWNNTSRIKNYLSDDWKNSITSYDPIREIEEKVEERFKGVDLLSRAQWLEMNLFMSGYLLSSQGDRMAMANSVEGRYPFLDYRVIEYCMKLPPNYRLNGLNEKILLKRMMAGKLPDEIVKRPKQPYRAPILESFFSNDAPGFVEEMLSNDRIVSAGIFDPVRVDQLSKKMRSKGSISEIDNMAISGILATQILDDLFVKKSIPSLLNTDLVKFDIEIIQD